MYFSVTLNEKPIENRPIHFILILSSRSVYFFTHTEQSQFNNHNQNLHQVTSPLTSPQHLYSRNIGPTRPTSPFSYGYKANRENHKKE